MIKVVPWANIESKVEMFKGPDASRLLLIDGNPPDIVLDCIDDVNTKAELIAYCIDHNIKVITSMGAGGKSDPTKLRIGMLSDCVNDPLASKIKLFFSLKIFSNQIYLFFLINKYYYLYIFL